MNESSPDDIAALEAELAEAERRVVRRVDPGATALPVAIAVLVLLGSLMLPWTGGVAGWEILAGVANLGLLPRLFTCTAVLFGVLGSAVALAGRLLGRGLDLRRGLRVLRRQRGVGDLVAPGRRPQRRHGPGSRPRAGGGRHGGAGRELGEDRRPPGLTSSRA